MTPHGVFRKKKLVSVDLTAQVQPLSTGGGTPTGTVTFLVNKKTLGTVTLGGGQATLTVKAARVLRKSVTILYAGDGNFKASTARSPTLTPASVAKLARPIAVMRIRIPSHPGGARLYGKHGSP